MGPFSLNEVESHCRRAARGAGMSVGLAEEAGRAAAWLAAHGLPGAETLAAVLDRNQALDYLEVAPITGETPWRAPGVGVLCPVCTGAALSDRAHLLASGTAVGIRRCLHPLLLLPFAAQAAPDGGAVELTWTGVHVAVGATTLAVLSDRDGALLAPHADLVTLHLSRAAPRGGAGREGPVDVDGSAWNTLAAFAQRTYVPASETSRSRGAGAAASDND